MQKRRSFSSEFKAKVAIEALKEQQTLQELAQKYELHPNQISAWKQEFLQNSASVFAQGKKKEQESVDTGKLFEEIGRLKVEVDFLKKKSLAKPVEEKRAMIEIDHPVLSISRQCELVGLSRSVFYYQPAKADEENLRLMEEIDKLYLKYPFYGSRKMTKELNSRGYEVNRKRIQRLYQLMGVQAIGPKPNTSKPVQGHKIYPYLLRNLKIDQVNQVWATDLTYIPMPTGFMYLMAVVDLYSRKVISWGLSNSMDTDFCCKVLQEALQTGTPQIFNTDQGSQFTSDAFTNILKKYNIQISMDGKGRAIDNIFVERLWRSAKYEYLYLQRPEARILSRPLPGSKAVLLILQLGKAAPVSGI